MDCPMRFGKAVEEYDRCKREFDKMVADKSCTKPEVGHWLVGECQSCIGLPGVEGYTVQENDCELFEALVRTFQWFVNLNGWE